MTNNKRTKQSKDIEVCKYLFMIGKLCMYNFQVDPKDITEKTEKMMIESLSMMQMIICELLEIPKEDQLQGMRDHDKEYKEIDNMYEKIMSEPPN